MTRSPRPSVGPRSTKSTWSSLCLMISLKACRQRARSMALVAEVTHRAKNAAEPLVVADVVADEEGLAHGSLRDEGRPPRGESILIRRGRDAIRGCLAGRGNPVVIGIGTHRPGSLAAGALVPLSRRTRRPWP